MTSGAGARSVSLDVPPIAGDREVLPVGLCYAAARRALDAGQPALAASLCRRHLTWKPDDGKAWRMLGFCQFRLGRTGDAVELLSRANELRPHDVHSAIMLGACLFTVGRIADGVAELRRALTLEPDSPYRWAMYAQTQLLFGEYESGWRNLEARWQAPQLRDGLPFMPSPQFPLWDGSDIRDRPLCVHGEGGFGDVIMFSRFVPAMVSRARDVYLAVSPALERLLGAIPGVRGVMSRRDHLPDNALHTSFWSLPMHTGLRLEDLPGTESHLHVPSNGPELGARRKLRVGLVWAGGSGTTHNAHRSLPTVELLRPLCDVTAVEWVSLQFGDRADEAAQLPVRTVPMPRDWAETAFLLNQLDLVISVDTAVAHLSGSMNIPTWIILPAVPEFRWLLDREDSPWYPSATLFRRESTDDWPELIARLRDAVVKLAV